MSAKKKKAPAQDSIPVGYGRPPVHSRFRKGQSGNPTGKRRHGEAERAQALIWKEAYRSLTLREGDKLTRMPALQAVARSLMTCAVKGNIAAQRAVVKLLQDREAKARARGTGTRINKNHNGEVEEMTDEELMNILKVAQNDKP